MRSQDIWVALATVMSLALLTILVGERNVPSSRVVRGLLAMVVSGAFLLALGRRSVAP